MDQITRYWHPETQRYYTAAQAQRRLKVLGVTPDNCEQHGLYIPAMQPKPALTELQSATLKPLPELVDGVWTKVWEVNDVPITDAIIKAERDRRLEADFEFQGKMFQRDSKSLDRITGAATLAGFAIAGGAQPGNLRWANPDRDFGWIASDDTVVPMDAQTAFAFGQVAAARETSIIFAAKALREMDPIPTDFTDDKWWP